MEKEHGFQQPGLAQSVDIHTMLLQKPSYIKLEMRHTMKNIMRNAQNAA
jgi:hypothetical protein